jgi:predicted TIM-barrel fold metal-dependent hydrolase
VDASARFETRFASHHELATLPYFRAAASGGLELADRSLGPAIDVHTHLALAFLLPLQIDLEREHPRTEHYLGLDRPVDLDVYANRNFSPADLRRMKLDLTALSITGRGMRRTHTVPNLLREMREMGVTHSVLLAIDLPAISRNAADYLRVARPHPELVCYGSVHPLSTDLAGKLDRQVALGARGIKLHPASQMIRPDHPRAMRLYRLCGERQLPVLFHCGPVGIEPAPGRRRSQVRLYEAPVAENPHTTFVLGHSGALQFGLALALARRYPNVWLETASQSLTNVRRLVHEAPPDRVLFGSDWPFYSQATSMVKVLIATEGEPRARRRMLYENAARLLGLETATEATATR